MVIYLLIGVIWSMFLEFVIVPQVEIRPMNNLTRVVQVLLWPLNIILFIYGYFRGKNNDNPFDN